MEKEFSKKEVDRILKRALELQEEELRASGSTGNLTTSDIVAIARDTGIGGRHIEQAIGELETAQPGKSGHFKTAFFGGPSTITLRRRFEPVLTKEQLGELIPVIQNALKIRGFPSVIGNTLTWSHDDFQTGRTIGVTVTSRETGTEIEAEAHFGRLKGGLFGGFVGGWGGGMGIGLGLGIGLGALNSFLFPLLWIPGVLCCTWLLARTIFRGITKSARKKMTKLLKDLGAKISDFKKN